MHNILLFKKTGLSAMFFKRTNIFDSVNNAVHNFYPIEFNLRGIIMNRGN